MYILQLMHTPPLCVMGHIAAPSHHNWSHITGTAGLGDPRQLTVNVTLVAATGKIVRSPQRPSLQLRSDKAARTAIDLQHGARRPLLLHAYQYGSLRNRYHLGPPLR